PASSPLSTVTHQPTPVGCGDVAASPHPTVPDRGSEVSGPGTGADDRRDIRRVVQLVGVRDRGDPARCALGLPGVVEDVVALDQRPRAGTGVRSEEHTSELQSRENLVCRLLLEKKNTNRHTE